MLLEVAHFDVGDPSGLALGLVELEHAVVEAVVVAAYFIERGVGLPARLPVADGARSCRRLADVRGGREEVGVVVLGVHDWQFAGRAVERRKRTARVFVFRVDVRHAVVVDVAHVVVARVFAGEHGLDVGLRIADLVVGHFAGQIVLGLVFVVGARLRRVVDYIGLAARLGGADEAVEEAVVVFVAVFVVGAARRLRGVHGAIAVGIDPDVLFAVERAVVDRANRIAECVGDELGGEVAVPLGEEAFRAVEGSAADPHVALADTGGVRVLHRNRNGSVAGRRAGRDRRQELRRLNLIVVGQLLRAAAVLVLNGDGDGLDAEGVGAEHGIEVVARIGVAGEEHAGVLAAINRNFDAVRGDVRAVHGGRPLVRLVELAFAAQRDGPLDGIGRAARHLVGVRLAIRYGAVAELRRHVVDVYARQRALRVVGVPRLTGLVVVVRRHDFRLEREALPLGKHRAVKLGNGNALRARTAEKDVVFVFGKVRIAGVRRFLVGGVELEKPRLRRRDGQLDEQVLLVVVGKRDVDRRVRLCFVDGFRGWRDR